MKVRVVKVREMVVLMVAIMVREMVMVIVRKVAA